MLVDVPIIDIMNFKVYPILLNNCFDSIASFCAYLTINEHIPRI